MKCILASVYAVNPYKGSEDGMGWNFILQIARFNKVIAITRENNQAKVEQYMAENHNILYQNIQFVYFDLPYWVRFWKKGGNGAMLYYLMWQYGIVGFIKKTKMEFDIVHNVNFHNDWSPSFLWKLDKPFVWGPVGHHPLMLGQYLKQYAKKYWLKDRLTWLVKKYFWHFSYLLDRTKKSASHIICMNRAVSNLLGLEEKFSVMPSVATQDFGWEQEQTQETFTVISAGRFVPLKGFDLTITAFAQMLNTLPAEDKKRCRLILVGSGPEEGLLKKLVEQYQIKNQVQFFTWIKRLELMQIFKKSSVFMFPSHEGAGMVVAEALSFGLPVICLDNEGPGEFINSKCGIAVPQGSYAATIEHLVGALAFLYANKGKHSEMRLAARKRFENHFHWDRRGEQLQKIYAEL